MTTALPHGASFYKRTPTFTEESVPAGLLNDHSTKEGCWGRLCVEAGRLLYAITDPAVAPTQTILTPEAPAMVIEPGVLHRVEPLGPVRFHVEFFRMPVAG